MDPNSHFQNFFLCRVFNSTYCLDFSHRRFSRIFSSQCFKHICYLTSKLLVFLSLNLAISLYFYYLRVAFKSTPFLPLSSGQWVQWFLVSTWEVWGKCGTLRCWFSRPGKWPRNLQVQRASYVILMRWIFNLHLEKTLIQMKPSWFPLNTQLGSVLPFLFPLWLS